MQAFSTLLFTLPSTTPELFPDQWTTVANQLSASGQTKLALSLLLRTCTPPPSPAALYATVELLAETGHLDRACELAVKFASGGEQGEWAGVWPRLFDWCRRNGLLSRLFMLNVTRDARSALTDYLTEKSDWETLFLYHIQSSNYKAALHLYRSHLTNNSRCSQLIDLLRHSLPPAHYEWLLVDSVEPAVTERPQIAIAAPLSSVLTRLDNSRRLATSTVGIREIQQQIALILGGTNAGDNRETTAFYTILSNFVGQERKNAPLRSFPTTPRQTTKTPLRLTRFDAPLSSIKSNMILDIQWGLLTPPARRCVNNQNAQPMSCQPLLSTILNRASLVDSPITPSSILKHSCTGLPQKRTARFRLERGQGECYGGYVEEDGDIGVADVTAKRSRLAPSEVDLTSTSVAESVTNDLVTTEEPPVSADQTCVLPLPELADDGVESSEHQNHLLHPCEVEDSRSLLESGDGDTVGDLSESESINSLMTSCSSTSVASSVARATYCFSPPLTRARASTMQKFDHSDQSETPQFLLSPPLARFKTPVTKSRRARIRQPASTTPVPRSKRPSNDEEEDRSFNFSPPLVRSELLTRSSQSEAGNDATPMAMDGRTFVFSPPLTRSRAQRKRTDSSMDTSFGDSPSFLHDSATPVVHSGGRRNRLTLPSPRHGLRQRSAIKK